MLADRRGRRQLLIFSAVAGCLATVLGAFAPNLWWLGATQTVARGFATALALLVAVVAVEEMPKGSRAYAISVLAMAAALGACSGAVFALVAMLAQPDKVGSVTAAQVREIAQTKMPDLNANTIEAAEKIIAGTARSMGITVKD